MTRRTRRTRPTRTFAVAALATLSLATGAAQAVADGARPETYRLTGDVGTATGSKFEGIGADERRGLFYVSEVTGGEIHRGSVNSGDTEEWLAGDGTDGRFTARGITVDDQGNAGLLWRIDAVTGAVSQVESGGADLVNADGLVLIGNRLTVVRNFSRMIATLRLSADGSRAMLLEQQATAADRVLTTAKALRGRILYVDSKFDEPVATGPYEIVTDPTR